MHSCSACADRFAAAGDAALAADPVETVQETQNDEEEQAVPSSQVYAFLKLIKGLN